MIAPQGRRAPHAANPVYHEAPNAALLIDFDNVTMGIRSDLGKELKALLNSDVIKGKVSVQRAYADWRRYPQYIVPLAESSIDLIFAPAYGSSKKNATDLRMAIDAIELVFTRPEIGTFILLTGDSDFSSCVLKLKEYGKYVIGVGMRESSSDLLIQNCDEYYSYHSLSGLTRTEEIGVSREDPWDLARRAAQQMVADRDVMRTDRLKQVMLSLDPGFDEKKLGYSKFSRFVQEAASKGLFRLKKLENGQFELALADGEKPAAVPAAERGEVARPRRSGDGRRRRGPAPAEAAAPEVAPAAEAPVPPAVELAAAPAAPAAAGSDLQSAYALLQHALRALAEKNGKWVRDGDVKRKMLEFAPDFDEAKLGFSKFSRFLRQAHDAEIIDLNRVGTGHYEVALSARAPRLAPPPAPAAPEAAAAPPATTPRAPAAEPAAGRPAAAPAVPGGLHARRVRRGMAPEGPPPILPGQVIRPPVVPASPAMPAEAAPARRRGRGRRGGRARGAEEAPPTLLPGQVVATPAAEEAPPTESPELGVQPAAASEAAAPAAAEAPKKPRGRTRTRKTTPAAEARPEAPAPEPVPEPVFSAADLGLPGDASAITAYLSNSYRGIGKKTAEALLEAFGEDLFRVMQEEPQRVHELLGDRRASTLLEQWAADYTRRMGAAAPATETVEEPAAEVAPEVPKKRRTRSRTRTRKAAPAADAAAQVEASAAQAEPQPAGVSAEQPEEEPRRGRSRQRRGGRGRSRKKQEQPASA